MWCADLRAALAVAPPDSVERLVERAAEWSAAPALHLMLVRAGHALDVMPPADLVRRLSPGAGWSGFVRGVEEVCPVARETGGPSLPRVVARSAQGNASGSWRAFARKASIIVVGRMGLGERPFLGGPDDPRSGYYADGGPSARASFLAGLKALDE